MYPPFYRYTAVPKIAVSIEKETTRVLSRAVLRSSTLQFARHKVDEAAPRESPGDESQESNENGEDERMVVRPSPYAHGDQDAAHEGSQWDDCGHDCGRDRD